MLRSLWTAKTGMDAQQTNLDTISNNLANVSTTAYKRVRPVFEDLLYQNLRSPGLMEDSSGDYLPTGLQAGNGSTGSDDEVGKAAPAARPVAPVAKPAPVAQAEDDTPPFDVDDTPAPTAPVQAAKPSSQKAEDILAMIRNRKTQ